jgi:uncharacterized OsmC-like protein
MNGNRHLRMTVNPDDTVTVTNKHGTELLVSAVDFAILMRKQRDPVEPLHLEVDGDKEDHRMRWLRVTYHVHEGADERKLERSRAKVAEDLCTVSRTLASGTPVDHVIA